MGRVACSRLELGSVQAGSKRTGGFGGERNGHRREPAAPRRRGVAEQPAAIPGYGLGLAIVRAIAGAHGAAVTANARAEADSTSR